GVRPSQADRSLPLWNCAPLPTVATIRTQPYAYDPALGQFIQKDPIGFAAGDLNLYAYVWNDPYNWTDPGEMGDLDFESSGIGGDLETIPWTNMGANQAYALATRLQESINFRIYDNQINPDAGHGCE
ncbi:RHS repeat-associated core domain-containing protein, partial [Parasulfitobacter algicola]